jgi:hypothetical protein
MARYQTTHPKVLTIRTILGECIAEFDIIGSVNVSEDTNKDRTQSIKKLSLLSTPKNKLVVLLTFISASLITAKALAGRGGHKVTEDSGGQSIFIPPYLPPQIKVVQNSTIP